MPEAPRVALFVTCLVDLFRPTIGFAAVKLLEQAGCTVEVPPTQVCCGHVLPRLVDFDTSMPSIVRSAMYTVPSFATATSESLPPVSRAGLDGGFTTDEVLQCRPSSLDFDHVAPPPPGVVM